MSEIEHDQTPYAWTWWQLMEDSIGGWEQKLERYKPSEKIKTENIRDLLPLYTHSQDTIPANPAQVTDAMVAEAAKSLGHEGVYISYETIRRALTAAIGAGNETLVGRWEIDRSTDSPILTYENCSVIQDEQAFYVLGLIRAALGAGGAK